MATIEQRFLLLVAWVSNTPAALYVPIGFPFALFSGCFGYQILFSVSIFDMHCGAYDAAVTGAGVVGSLVVRELSRYQLHICLLEKEDIAMGAARINSAIVHDDFAIRIEELLREALLLCFRA